MVTLDKIEISEDYKPSEKEEYMCDKHLLYFKNKLTTWKNDLIRESNETRNHLKEEVWDEPDDNDRATLETETALELKTRDRYRKLIDKIDAAIKRIEDGSYGFCEDTGEPIGLKRLDARPVATLSIEAQERHEKHEKTHIDEKDDV